MTLHDLCVRRWADSSPDLEALCSPGQRLSYRELLAETDRCARALLAAGFGHGDRLAVLGRSRGECLVLFLAASSVGGVYVGLDARYTMSEIDRVVTDTSPALLVVTDRHRADYVAENVSPVLEGLPVVALSGGDPGWLSWEGFLADGNDVDQVEVDQRRDGVSGTDPAAIIFTSGSTGRPKGAVLSHAALAHGASLDAENMWPPRPRTVTVLPINHVAWLIETCLAVLVAGGTLFFEEKFDPEGMLELAERERLNSLFLLASMLHACLASPDFDTRDLTSIERLLFAGPVSVEALDRFRTVTGAGLVTGLGMTETAGGYTFTEPEADLTTLSTTLGRPHPSVQLRLVDTEGGQPEPGEPGEIRVWTPALFDGYLGLPEATKESFDDEGYFRTGDVAVQLPDGSIRLVGRLKEMFKSGGYNVYPREIESRLVSHPHVAQVAIIGVPDPRWDEVGLAFVVTDGGEELRAEELRSFLREHLAGYKIPKLWVQRTALPLLPTGKIDKGSLSGSPEARRLAPDAD